MKTFAAFVATATARWDFESYIVRPTIKEPDFDLETQPMEELDCTNYLKKNLCTELYWDPICGTDGKYRANPCIFKSEYCYGNKDLEFLRRGTDCSVNEMLLDVGEEEEEEEIEEPEEPECRIYCPRIYDPVCGDNGVLYDNECQMRLQNCLNGSDVREQVGANRMLDQVCHGGVTYGNRDMFVLAKCDAQREGDKNARDWEATDGACAFTRAQRCEKACPAIFDPVCGSDGNRYSNECAMEVTACFQDEKITRLNPPHRMYAPVCASNGEEYANDIVFLWAKCEAQDNSADTYDQSAQTWRVVSQGPCEAEEEEEEEDNGMQMDVGIPKLCPSCGTFRSEVCGSDGVTYTNSCLMDKAACEQNIPIEVVHPGGCCPKFQTRDMRIVCGSDGIEYTNLSFLQSASCANDFSIRYVKDGSCNNNGMLMDTGLGFGNDFVEEEEEEKPKKKQKKRPNRWGLLNRGRK